VTGVDHALAGTVFLRRGTGAVVAHRAEVLRLMVRPDLQSHGLGDEAAGRCRRPRHRARAGAAAALGPRGHLIATFYTRQGWTQVGVFPASLRLGPDDIRDEHWFQLRLS
jgi:acetyltransferase